MPSQEAKSRSPRIRFDSIPAFLVDQDGIVIELTKAAGLLVERKVLLTLTSRHKLSALHLENRRALATLFTCTTRQLARLRGKEGLEYLALCRPLPSKAEAPNGSQHLLIVVPVETASQWDIAEVGRLYGLTPAESRLVEALVDSGSLDGAMKRLGITRNTVRAQMSVVFRKTNTTRQGELIRLFTRIATIAHMCDDF